MVRCAGNKSLGVAENALRGRGVIAIFGEDGRATLIVRVVTCAVHLRV